MGGSAWLSCEPLATLTSSQLSQPEASRDEDELARFRLVPMRLFADLVGSDARGVTAGWV